MKSTGARTSNDLQRLDLDTGCHDTSSSNDHQVDTPLNFSAVVLTTRFAVNGIFVL